MTERLTTLAAVKEWLDIAPDQVEGDAGLLRVLDAASQFILSYLNRDSFAAQAFTQNFRGNGKNTMLLRNWPVLTVSSVGISGSEVKASVDGNFGMPGNGYRISDPRNSNQSIDLYGTVYSYNVPCQIVYEAGYRTTQSIKITSVTSDDEPPVTTVMLIVPNAGGQWISGISVLIDNGVAVKVDADPAAGQYAVDEWGNYTFSIDDVGKTATITYCYVPWDVSFAVVETIGEWYRRKERIGVLSKTLGGQETITFSQKDISDVSSGIFQSYKNVVPI
jgi:hypothetical protein